MGKLVERTSQVGDFGPITSYQLHHFSDASQVAYGAVSYLWLVNTRQEVQCSFVMGKSRLSPLKPMAIPRMELSATVLSTRLDRIIRKEIDFAINDSVFWTESTCVLRYVAKEETRHKTFVGNRVSAIREQSSSSQWKYVGTKANPANDASRGLPAEAFASSNRWNGGPAFLWENQQR